MDFLESSCSSFDRRDWQASHAGTENAGVPPIERGITWSRVRLPDSPKHHVHRTKCRPVLSDTKDLQLHFNLSPRLTTGKIAALIETKRRGCIDPAASFHPAVKQRRYTALYQALVARPRFGLG